MGPAEIEALGIKSHGYDLLGSMGIYLFNRDVLVDILSHCDHRDFGHEMFPELLADKHVHAHLFDGYWEDIGTIGLYFSCNLKLASLRPPFEFSHPNAPIYTRSRHLPPTRIEGATVKASLIADGCIIEEGAIVENSVVGLRCHIGKNVVVRDSILLGSDHYDSLTDRFTCISEVSLGIGRGSRIEGAIVDKNCRIGEGVQLINCDQMESADLTNEVLIRDGVIVVQRNSCLEDGWAPPQAYSRAEHS